MLALFPLQTEQDAIFFGTTVGSGAVKLGVNSILRPTFRGLPQAGGAA